MFFKNIRKNDEPAFQILNNIRNTFLYFKKKFGFQEGNYTERTLIQLIDQINNSFEKNHFTLVILVDLSKAFDTIDHSILIKKIKLMELKETT